MNHERGGEEMESVEVVVGGGHEPYEPPCITVVGPFHDLTAGESRGGWADDSGKSPRPI